MGGCRNKRCRERPMKKGRKEIEWGGEDLRNKMLQLLRLQFLSFLFFLHFPTRAPPPPVRETRGCERKANFPLS